MTTTEALLAMKIGCKVVPTIVPTKWGDFDAYYEIQDNYIRYVYTTLSFSYLVCNVNKFIEEYEGMEWKLYDC